MHHSNYALILIGVFALLASVLLIINISTTPTKQASNSLTVAASIFPIADITQRIAGPNVRVIQIIPSGASPHSFSLSPKQISELMQAQALFTIGHGLDDFAVQFATKAKDIPIFELSQNINLRYIDHNHEHHHNDSTSIDPHYWLSVPNVQLMATTITNTLADINPDQAATYHSNLANYLAELQQLESELQALSNSSPNKSFIAIHDAWSYFTDQYNLNLVATYEPIEGKPPTLADIKNLQNLIQEHNITTFFTEPQKQATSTTKLMHDEFGLVTKVIDPLGGNAPNDSYIATMRNNMLAIIGNN